MFETYIIDSDRLVTVHKSAMRLHQIATGYTERVGQFVQTEGAVHDTTVRARWHKKHDRMLNNAMRLLWLAQEADRCEH